MNPVQPSPGRGRWAWVMYDWANSVFATTVLAGFFPVFFKTWWSADLPNTTSTFYLGAGSAVSSIIVMVLAPLGGALADHGQRKKHMLAWLTAIGVVTTAALFLVGRGQWSVALALFVTASVAFFLALVFYDSLIVDVAPPGALDRLSSQGFALGYLGGGILLAVNVWMIRAPASFGLAGQADAVRWSFLGAAVWWGVFSLPLFVRVRQTHSDAGMPAGTAVMTALASLTRTWRAVCRQPAIRNFLLAYWLYIDGVHTIIRMAVDFGLNLGFGAGSLITALLLVQFIGFPAAVAFGYLGERWDTRKAILLGLTVYAIVTAWGFFMTQAWQFFVMAGLIGLVQGGVQALSRAFFARLIEADRAGEYFGLYNLMGKFAAVLGPLLVGITAVLTGSSRLSILAVLILFALGGLLLARVKAPENQIE